MDKGYITLSHGSGGLESNELISGLFYEILGDCIVDGGQDAGVGELNAPVVVSTDSYVVSPLIFPGGDIGKLCVCGSSNDVAMRGGKPKYLSLGLILEEGLEIATLRQILESIKNELDKGGLKILSGDTKVVPHGLCDKMYINTTAIGELVGGGFSTDKIQVGDQIIINAPLGTHGAVIFGARNEIALQSDLKSDCAQLYGLLECLEGVRIHAVRDATRGGLAAVLNEWSRAVGVEIEIYEEKLPILEQVRGVCEILGLDVLSLANEGVCVIAAPKQFAEEIIKRLRGHELGRYAQIVGEVGSKQRACVILQNAWGARRYVEYPQGELLPRIC